MHAADGLHVVPDRHVTLAVRVLATIQGRLVLEQPIKVPAGSYQRSVVLVRLHSLA